MNMYTVSIKTKSNKEEIARYTTQADSIKQARETAQAQLNDGLFAQVYCDISTAEGILEASREIVKRVTAGMIQREGGEIQHRLYIQARKPIIDDCDVLDCISVVNLCLLEWQGEDVEIAYLQAYRAMYNHLYSMRAVKQSVTDMRTIYIEDIDGDIINVSKGINAIVNASNPLPNIEDSEPEHNESVTQAIIDLMKDFTPTQRKVITYLANGYSLRQIADKMNRKSVSNIHQHKELARKKALARYPQGVDSILSELLHNID